MMNKKCISVFILLICLLLIISTANGQEENKKDHFDSVEALIRMLEEKKIISFEESREFIRRHVDKEKQEGMGVLDDEYYKGDEHMVSDLPDWIRRFRFSGDLSVRYEANLLDGNNIEDLDDPLNPNPNDPSDDINTTEDRHRGRYRLRLGVQAAVANQVEAGMRFSTGSKNNPVSTYNTMGDYFNKDDFLVDRAYIRWEPYPYDSFTGFIAWAGRMQNPFYSTSLVWDSDVNLEGGAANFQTRISENWNFFSNFGIFSLQEVEQYQDDKWMYAVQTGMEYSIRDVIDNTSKFRFKIAAAYYDYQNMIGQRNESSLVSPYLDDPTNDPSAPLFVQMGNTLKIIDFNGSVFETGLAADYNLLNLTGEINIGVFDPFHVVLFFDYVKNLGYDKDKVNDALLIEEKYAAETDGYALGIAVGIPKVRSFMDWKISLAYKHIERDAVLDAFTDSDFHLGGANAEGWDLAGELGLTQNVWLSARWISANEINPAFQPVFFKREGQLAADTFKFDVNARF
jgi:hypothetical protein